ncbi:MAG: hypothetical protein FWH03_08490 [Firmicutes bacterium]|nr:hypothetical protein [Bacillota bacterium]
MLVPAKCTQCGANIKVDDELDAAVCTHCQTAFITQKAIHNYNTHVTNKIVLDASAQESLLKDLSTLAAAEERCEKLYALAEYAEVGVVALTMIQKWPESHLGYLWEIKSFREFYNFNTEKYQESIDWRVKLHTSASVFVGGSVRHPMYAHYQKLIKHLTPQQLTQYADVIETAKKIFTDFQQALSKFVAKCKKGHAINMGISLTALAATVLTAVLSAIYNLVGLEIAFIVLSILVLFVPIWFIVCFTYYNAFNKRILSDTYTL